MPRTAPPASGELFPSDSAARAHSGSDTGPGSDPAPGADAPLAERMRPRSLEEFQGQEHLLGPDRPLRPVVEGEGRLSSMIFWGPPGSGKTTLAALLAARAGLRFAAVSAVLSGVKDLRAEVARAEEARQMGRATVLFVDEIHRFNKAQQDALLPYVERGTVVLIGATTENPSFEVISALRSRARVFTLKALEAADIAQIVQTALHDGERGLGASGVGIAPEALDLLTRLAVGDARRALTLLDAAAERADGRIERAQVEAAVEARLPDYDKDGDQHYDVISAFIKSMRGSDPDASMYWLMRMLEAGEDPRFVTRRMIIFASEDIGNADPRALAVANDAAIAFDRIGLPEGKLILSQAVTYLASAPKSNSALNAMAAAGEAVREHGALPVPMHLRNAPTPLMKSEGHGDGYRYPHSHEGHFVPAQYLPDRLADERFYEPGDQGDEADIAARLHAWWGTTKRAPVRKVDKSGDGDGS
ncbi:MAG: replication-associated recombination protein A [Deltaproteobacteria bacterium]|nr:replication-associated recombination protein A [Deltaproteobacteria bacterium]